MVRRKAKTREKPLGGPAKQARTGRNKGGKRSGPPDSMTLSKLEQLRVLADPLRMRILEALGKERTTKQVAEEIGESPTKLYHHVDALKKVGLIRLIRTRRNRGTLEKYYQVAALSFRPDASLFPQAGYKSSVMAVISNLLGKAGSELEDLAACGQTVSDLEEKAILGWFEIRAPEKEIQEARAKLDAFLQNLRNLADCDYDGKDAQRYRLMLAYYPLLKPSSGG